MSVFENNSSQNSPFSERLSVLIKESNVNQQKLAEFIGTTRQSISLYSTGKRKPDIEILNKLCDFFNVSSDYLLGRTNSKSLDIDNISINKNLGLSDKAIDVIETINNPITLLLKSRLLDTNESEPINAASLDINIFNYFISEPAFVELFSSICTYITQSTINEVIEENFLNKYAKINNIKLDNKYVYDKRIYYLPVIHHSNFKELFNLRKESRHLNYDQEFEMFKIIKKFTLLIEQIIENNFYELKGKPSVKETLTLFDNDTTEDHELFVQHSLKNFRTTLEAWESTIKNLEADSSSNKSENKKKEN